MGNGHHDEGATAVCPAPEHHPICALPEECGQQALGSSWTQGRAGAQQGGVWRAWRAAGRSLFTSAGHGGQGWAGGCSGVFKAACGLSKGSSKQNGATLLWCQAASRCGLGKGKAQEPGGWDSPGWAPRGVGSVCPWGCSVPPALQAHRGGLTWDHVVGAGTQDTRGCRGSS